MFGGDDSVAFSFPPFFGIYLLCCWRMQGRREKKREEVPSAKIPQQGHFNAPSPSPPPRKLTQEAGGGEFSCSVDLDGCPLLLALIIVSVRWTHFYKLREEYLCGVLGRCTCYRAKKMRS